MKTVLPKTFQNNCVRFSNFKQGFVKKSSLCSLNTAISFEKLYLSSYARKI